jgi:hypothetical protein
LKSSTIWYKIGALIIKKGVNILKNLKRFLATPMVTFLVVRLSGSAGQMWVQNSSI